MSDLTEQEADVVRRYFAGEVTIQDLDPILRSLVKRVLADREVTQSKTATEEAVHE